MAVRVMPRSSSSLEAEVLVRDRVLAADRGAEVRRVVGAERDPHPGLAQHAAAGAPRSSGRPRGRRCWSGSTSSTIPRSASSSTSAGSSIARTPWPMRVTGSSSAPRTESGPAHSPACTVQPRPGGGRDLDRPRRRARAGSRPRRRPARSRRRRGAGARRRSSATRMRPLDAEVAHRRRSGCAPSMPWSRARVVDPGGDARPSARRRSGRRAARGRARRSARRRSRPRARSAARYS